MATLLLLSEVCPAFAAESVTNYSAPDSAAQAETVMPDDSGDTAPPAQTTPVTPDAPAPDDDSGGTADPAQAETVTPDDSGDTANSAQTEDVTPGLVTTDDDSSDGENPVQTEPVTSDAPAQNNDSGDTKKPLLFFDVPSSASDLAALCSSGSSAAAEMDKDGPPAQGQSPTKEEGTSTIAGGPVDTPTYYYYKVQVWVSYGADFKLNTIFTPLLGEPEEKLPWPALWPQGFGFGNKHGASEFEDVLEKHYFFDSVSWAVRNGITNGTTETTFSPSENCTHWQILTFLWRICGEPRFQVSKKKNIFKGLDYAEKRVHIAWWAMSYGLRMPVDGEFGGDQPCTRAQAMYYIWRLSGCPAPREKATFTDLPENDQYVSAISWAVEQGITNGTSETTFSPNNICNRANIVTFLYRAWQSARPNKAH